MPHLAELRKPRLFWSSLSPKLWLDGTPLPWRCPRALSRTGMAPSASSGYLIEMDDLWSPPVNRAAARRDWRTLSVDLLSKLCMESIQTDQLYGYREKAKLQPELGEKLLRASGQQGVFVRPLVPDKGPNAAHYTVSLWCGGRNTRKPRTRRWPLFLVTLPSLLRIGGWLEALSVWGSELGGVTCSKHTLSYVLEIRP